MQKVILAVLVIAVLAVGVPRALEFYRRAHPDPAIAAKAADAARTHAQKAATAEQLAQQQKQAAALAAERQPIEAALKTMNVSSLMLGEPPVCIINKNDYSVGDALPLPGGRKLQVTSIREDGVGLACHGQAYHLGAPAAPDLAALRKAR